MQHRKRRTVSRSTVQQLQPFNANLVFPEKLAATIPRNFELAILGDVVIREVAEDQRITVLGIMRHIVGDNTRATQQLARSTAGNTAIISSEVPQIAAIAILQFPDKPSSMLVHEPYRIFLILLFQCIKDINQLIGGQSPFCAGYLFAD